MLSSQNDGSSALDEGLDYDDIADTDPGPPPAGCSADPEHVATCRVAVHVEVFA